jgi:hypothetical protein
MLAPNPPSLQVRLLLSGYMRGLTYAAAHMCLLVLMLLGLQLVAKRRHRRVSGSLDCRGR